MAKISMTFVMIKMFIMFYTFVSQQHCKYTKHQNYCKDVAHGCEQTEPWFAVWELYMFYGSFCYTSCLFFVIKYFFFL